MPGTQIEVGRPWRDPDETAHYSVMVAERIEPVTISSGVGELHVTGRMVDRQGALQGRFNQRLRLARGSRMLNVDIHLEPLVELPADPWAAYYACRFAWSDETADLVRSLHGTCQPTKIKRLEAPRFIEIHEGQKRTAILTGGLPYHRRVGQRMLDSLLIVHGETCRDFRIAIGLDLPDLAGRAEELLLPEFPTMPVNLPSVAREGWFFHLDRSNIVVLDWAPLTEENTTVGFRAKLLETAGRPGRVKLRTFRPVAQAQQVDARHHPIVTLSATGETILIDFSVFELVEIEARWAAS
jgi:alpha-mannosidase